ncbi:MAG: hypothetical protein AAGI23_14055 [Bacteroidota bacterium]
MSNVQLELLQTFNYDLSESDFQSFKQLLINFFAEKISNDVDAFFEENDLDDQVADDWANEHMRTPYLPEL